MAWMITTWSHSNMEVTITTEDENPIIMRIGCSDTVYQVKAKIFWITGTPISHQILVLRGRVLDNISNVRSYSINPNSRILLRIQDPFRGLTGPPMTAELKISIAKHPETFISLPTNLSDTVLQLKQKLQQQSPGLPALDRLGVYRHKKKHELQDAKCLSDYGLSTGSMLDVFIKPSLTPLPPSPCTPKKLNIWVLTCGQRLYLQVNTTDQVGVLREELKDLSWGIFRLSSHYFFVHSKCVLDETATFLVNDVEDDDEIEIVHGSVHLLLEQLMRTSGDAHIPTCRFSPLLCKSKSKSKYKYK